MSAIIATLLLSLLAMLGSVYSVSFGGSYRLGRQLPMPATARFSEQRTVTKRSGGSGDQDGGFLVIAEAPPKLLEARQHGNIVLECSASGNPAPQITWFKDGQPLMEESLLDGDYDGFAPESLSETRSKISLNCVSERDAGLYECVAHTSNKKTSVGTEVQVASFAPNGCRPHHLLDFVTSPPVIYQWMSTYLQLLGTDAHLICRAKGRHATQWRGPLDNVLQDDGKYKVLANGDLVIRDLSFDDMGMYRCEVRNANGDDTKETFLYPHAA